MKLKIAPILYLATTRHHPIKHPTQLGSFAYATNKKVFDVLANVRNLDIPLLP